MGLENNFSSLFATESDAGAVAEAVTPPPWQVLLVDDEPMMHTSLRLAMQGMVVEGRQLVLIDAGSASEAQAALIRQPEVALILLDVVMETNDAGLRFVQYVRQTLRNRKVRIVLLTGQPAYALERDVVANYEIDDYRLKTELTADKLFTCLYSTLRTYRALHELELKQPIERLALELQSANQRLTIEIADRTRAQALADEQMRALQEVNKKLEDAQYQLLQSERMASIGLLAAGVAHEINNPIGYVQSNLGALGSYSEGFLEIIAAYEAATATTSHGHLLEVEALKASLDFNYAKGDVGALVRETTDGLKRVQSIVQSLKDFSRIETSNTWAVEDVTKGIESTLSVVWNELKYKCEVQREYGDIPPVECILSHLNQVFLNLLINATQAIAERGTVTIRTGRKDDFIWIEIVDTGEGILPVHLPHVFDPFFTTKPVGKGTGLGLSISYGIVKKHHGDIEVESQPGKGTVFRVWLPRLQPKHQPGSLPGI